MAVLPSAASIHELVRHKGPETRLPTTSSDATGVYKRPTTPDLIATKAQSANYETRRRRDTRDALPECKQNPGRRKRTWDWGTRPATKQKRPGTKGIKKDSKSDCKRRDQRIRDQATTQRPITSVSCNAAHPLPLRKVKLEMHVVYELKYLHN